MKGVRSGTVILVDPGVRDVGVEPHALISGLHGPGISNTMLVPGLARHPELVTGAVKACGARRAVVVSAEPGHPPIAELRMWGQAGGLAPLGVEVVALDILRARRSPGERAAYALRMVRAAVAAVAGPGTAAAVRTPVGASLSRRALLNGRATTWAPVAEIRSSACAGSLLCGRCEPACPQQALQANDDLTSDPPTVDPSRCDGCSGCLDVCPTGALSLDGHDPGILAQRLSALLQGSDSSPTPALVIACQGAAEPLHHLGQRSGLTGWLVLEVACLGGIGSTWQLAALAAGAPAVQVLPCTRCKELRSVTKDLAFTRSLLTALGDPDASRRVGVLPAGGLQLKRALNAAHQLTALIDRTTRNPMPTPAAFETPARAEARVAAWAVGHLSRALSRPGQEHRAPVTGEGAPLGVVRAVPGCTACGVCARTCPTDALRLSSLPGSTDLVLDPAACTGCGICAQTCPEHVLEVTHAVDLKLLTDGPLPIAQVAAPPCPDCGTNVPALPATTHTPSMPAALASRCPRCRQAALLASA